MTVLHSRRDVLRAASVGIVAGLAGCGGASPVEQVERHRDTLSKYTDVGQAIEDGYQLSTPYVRTDQGVIGLQLYNRDVEDLDPKAPTVLFYDLAEDGTYDLMGVEWLVSAASADERPTMFGKDFSGPDPGETFYLPASHYGLHAWLFEDNPDGMFATYNPDVQPPSFVDDLETAWSALEPYYSNPEAAKADHGYTETETCASTADGGYGILLANADHAGTDLELPPILLYRISGTWNYQLLGAEWYVPADSVSSPPSMFGTTFHEPLDGHSSEFDQGSHYGLHAWLFAANPDGMFARYNPAVTCGGGSGQG